MSEVLDCRGLKCPQPVLKIAIKARSLATGSTLEVQADCESFQHDVEKWCRDNGKVLVSVVERAGGIRVATIQF